MPEDDDYKTPDAEDVVVYPGNEDGYEVDSDVGAEEDANPGCCNGHNKANGGALCCAAIAIIATAATIALFATGRGV